MAQAGGGLRVWRRFGSGERGNAEIHAKPGVVDADVRKQVQRDRIESAVTAAAGNGAGDDGRPAEWQIAPSFSIRYG